jgi:hypothetical protein
MLQDQAVFCKLIYHRNTIIRTTKCTQDTWSGSYKTVQVSDHNKVKKWTNLSYLPYLLYCMVWYHFPASSCNFFGTHILYLVYCHNSLPTFTSCCPHPLVRLPPMSITSHHHLFCLLLTTSVAHSWHCDMSQGYLLVPLTQHQAHGYTYKQEFS